MLTTEQFPRANDDWEERAERDKTWTQWKSAYKKAHAQARIKAQANDGTTKFGAANYAACQDTPKPTVDNQLELEDVIIKALEGYFDNLAAAAVNEKYVLQQLVLNNTTLATSNESLVDFVVKLTGDIKKPRTRKLAPQEGRTVQQPEHNPMQQLQERGMSSNRIMLRAS